MNSDTHFLYSSLKIIQVTMYLRKDVQLFFPFRSIIGTCIFNTYLDQGTALNASCVFSHKVLNCTMNQVMLLLITFIKEDNKALRR